jgi:tetratricopeptide (TPR) repeat protein
LQLPRAELIQKDETIGELPGTEGTKTFPLDATAMTQYALGSTKLIASLLIIPDAIALVPNSPSFESWALKLLGLWLSAAILWFVSFCAILQLVRLSAVGVRIDSQGVKTWRFARLMSWSKIEAVAVEDRQLFSRLFSLKRTARRLTLFVSKSNKPILAPNYLPSFLFSSEVFEELLRTVCRTKFGLVPEASNYFMAVPPALSKMKNTQRSMTRQTILVSLVVATGLVLFLAKKAAVNFAYNSGNKAMAQHDYGAAMRFYFVSVDLDRSFAFGWNKLAQAELYTHNFDRAKRHFRQAVTYKPDFVEAQLGLARLELDQMRCGSAKRHIDVALRVVPDDPGAQAVLAYYDVRFGQIEKGLGIVHKIQRSKASAGVGGTNTADLLVGLAQGEAWLHTGRPAEALDSLKKLDTLSADLLSLKTYYLLQTSCAIQLGDYEQARLALKKADHLCPYDTNVLNAFATLAMADEKLPEARTVLAELRKKRARDVQTRYNQAMCDYLSDNSELAKKELEGLIKENDIDAYSLVEAAEMLVQLGVPSSAQQAALRALSIDRDNQRALAIALGH